MNLPILILRPLDGARKTAARADDMGLEAIVDPLFTIEPLEWTPPPASRFDAVLLTSAHAVKCAGPALMQYQRLPALAVGDSTARAARKAGFLVRETGDGSAQKLLDSLQTGQYPNILRLAGKHHVKLTAGDRKITLCPVYQSLALSLGKKAQQLLTGETVILLHSSRAAENLAAEMARLNLNRAISHIVAISDQVARAAGPGWKSIGVAEQPTNDALLSLAARLCS